MKFTRISPHPSLGKLIECYWMMQSDDATPRIEKIIPDGFTELIFESNGMAGIKDLCEAGNKSERQLQRLFKKYIGLSPKYYARIIRFNYIFRLIKEKERSWAEIVFESGYYDQSHFIRNFKAFTGEDTSAYYFEAPNMANFFLNK